MSFIQVLDEPTINQIAAGEVVERPSAVVKELIENAMDAGASAITAEIKEGGLSLIRITDNGAGIAKEDIPFAFLRHATSKIRTAEDLLSVTSLGFRGEALSSIAAVAQVELITKTPSALNGYRYIIEGGEEKSMDEIGCPGGTTILVRNLFYNTPARRKFLKSPVTEAGYISDLMERLMVSHPEVSFKFIVNNQVKLQSSGNNNTKDILYHVYGRDITKELLPVNYHNEEVKVSGYIGKPLITRGNRNFENYFINGRYIKSNVITKAIEEAYKPFLMQHKYPFTSLYFEIDPSLIDVNVHPQKLEIRLKNSEEIYQSTYSAIRDTLTGKELIPKVTLTKQEEQKEDIIKLPEPFEANRRKEVQGKPIPEDAFASSTKSTATFITRKTLSDVDQGNQLKEVYRNPLSTTNVLRENITSYHESSITDEAAKTLIDQSMDNKDITDNKDFKDYKDIKDNKDFDDNINSNENNVTTTSVDALLSNKPDLGSQQIKTEQLHLFTTSETSEPAPFLSKSAFEEHRIIGQLFSTYWLVEYKKELYIIDQHAAHEKILYERIMAGAKNKSYVSQQLLPPIIISLTLREQEILNKYEDALTGLGYEFEPFGGNEYSIRAVPADLYGLSEKDLMLEFIDNLVDDITVSTGNTESILERVASLSCKAAIKANHTFSTEEASALIKELLTLENPYHCPHGRPVIISMSQYELERKFKRIL
jgi:DNA mismatch repair protein MutL